MEQNYSYYNEEAQKTIVEKENRDRYIAARMIYDNLKDGVDNISITPTDLFCSYDLTLNCDVPVPEYNTYSNCNVVVEIKERIKSDEQLRKYPDVELKISKYNRIKQEAQGKEIYYFVLLNEKTGYIFDITNIDRMKGVYTFDWHIKRRQMDEGSEYVIEPTYGIPVENAERVVDITQYYRDYYDANYIQE